MDCGHSLPLSFLRTEPRTIVVVRSANQRWFAERTTTICDSDFCVGPKTVSGHSTGPTIRETKAEMNLRTPKSDSVDDRSRFFRESFLATARIRAAAGSVRRAHPDHARRQEPQLHLAVAGQLGQSVPADSAVVVVCARCRGGHHRRWHRSLHGIRGRVQRVDLRRAHVVNGARSGQTLRTGRPGRDCHRNHWNPAGRAADRQPACVADHRGRSAAVRGHAGNAGRSAESQPCDCRIRDTLRVRRNQVEHQHRRHVISRTVRRKSWNDVASGGARPFRGVAAVDSAQQDSHRAAHVCAGWQRTGGPAEWNSDQPVEVAGLLHQRGPIVAGGDSICRTKRRGRSPIVRSRL